MIDNNKNDPVLMWKTLKEVIRGEATGSKEINNVDFGILENVEEFVKEQIDEYLHSNDIISEHQSGFRKHHSCETAIQSVIDDWKLIINEGKMVGVIFLDLKRAFETVNRTRLLEKLDQYGMKGRVLEWFRTYLSNRTQQVKFNINGQNVLKRNMVSHKDRY
ncbi:uncharacterized protein LOC112638673 [Camponotus floridanus]|uniref:uncharacterized protein LOC112638673 n=1 Tax=Camponotus floridanus TaxID=104421 RepID=UPI000DC68F69|nr:uncharacterized protein LOC112638673 [Camponotus floridanus]